MSGLVSAGAVEEEAPSASHTQTHSPTDRSATTKPSSNCANIDTRHPNNFKSKSSGHRKSSKAIRRSRQEAGSGDVDREEEQCGKRHKSGTYAQEDSIVTSQLFRVHSEVAAGKGKTEVGPFDNERTDGQLKGNGQTSGQLKKETARQLKGRPKGHQGIQTSGDIASTCKARPDLDTVLDSIVDTGADSKLYLGSESGSESESDSQSTSTSVLDSENEGNSQQADVDSEQLGNVDIASASCQVLNQDMLRGLLKGLEARLSLYATSCVAKDLTALEEMQAATDRWRICLQIQRRAFSVQHVC